MLANAYTNFITRLTMFTPIDIKRETNEKLNTAKMDKRKKRRVHVTIKMGQPAI